ncbi:MAG: hypothetical protein WDZ67_01490 [Patescibacteria group bacterium]
MVKSGQALILILLVMAVSLTLGVSVASRSIATLKQVSFSAQSAQALAFAEGGAEEALKCLDDGSCSAPYDPAAVDLTGDGTNDFDYRITALGGAVLDAFPALSRDQTIELSLSGYPSGTPVYISWVNTANSSEVSDPAAVEIAAIYNEAGTYKVLRYAYDPVAARQSENSFFTPFTGPFSVNGVNYQYRVSISVPFTPVAIRIRPLYSATASTFVFSAEVGRTLPTTGARIESSGFSGSVIRKVEVLRTNNALSELFDFAIFSGSETSPLSK